MYGLSERDITAVLLIACFLIFTVGGMLYTARAIWKWPSAQTPRFLRWERGFVVLAILVNLWGIALLDDLLNAAGETIIPRMAMMTYLVGVAVILVAEMAYLHNREWNYSQVVLHIVLLFFAQAAFGVALLRTDLVASWVGWVAIIWNLGWLGVLTFARPKDIYFPVLHHVAPLIIGIMLLVSK